MKVTVLKQTVRDSTKRKHLPSSFRMFLAGCWLYDILKANNHCVHLSKQTYWVRCKSLDSKRLIISWED
jgi:hypothetical protein